MYDHYGENGQEWIRLSHVNTSYEGKRALTRSKTNSCTKNKNWDENPYERSFLMDKVT